MPDSTTRSEFAFELTGGHIEKSTKDSAAFDVFYAGNSPMWIGDFPVIVPTGVFSKFSKNLVCRIEEKSGLALKGLEVKGGVIDADYRKEWGVIVRNPVFIQSFMVDPLGGPKIDANGEVMISYAPVPNWKPFKLEPGEKVAQFLVLLLPDVHFYSMPTASITYIDQERTGGFGSTDEKKAI